MWACVSEAQAKVALPPEGQSKSLSSSFSPATLWDLGSNSVCLPLLKHLYLLSHLTDPQMNPGLTLSSSELQTKYSVVPGTPLSLFFTLLHQDEIPVLANLLVTQKHRQRNSPIILELISSGETVMRISLVFWS